jgi:hypothetical protein
VSQPLSLKCDILVSKLASKWVNLYRSYTEDESDGDSSDLDLATTNRSKVRFLFFSSVDPDA